MRTIGVYLNGLHAKGLTPLDEVLIKNVAQLKEHLDRTPSAQGTAQLALTNLKLKGPWTGIRRFPFNDLRSAPQFPAELGRPPLEPRMDTANALSDFLEELIENGNAATTSIIFGGHSDGANRVLARLAALPDVQGNLVLAYRRHNTWRRIDGDLPSQLIQDVVDASPTWLDPTELTMALGKALKTPNDQSRLEVIGLDACCASSVELANALAPYARFLVSSEIGSPLEGWNYERCLSEFSELGSSSRSAAESLVDVFECQHQSTTKVTKSVALSAIALDGLPAITSSVATFVNTLSAPISQSMRATLLEARKNSLLRDNLLIRVDMFSFFRSMSQMNGVDDSVAKAALGVCDAVQNAVVKNWYQHGTDGETTPLMGLSLCFPTLPGDFDATWLEAFAPGGGLTDFWKQTGWDQFLIALRT